MIRTIVFLALFCLATDIFSGYPSLAGCPSLSDGSFRVEKLLGVENGLNEPIQMDFDVNSAGDVDIYFTQRKGEVKKYDGTAGQVSTLMTLGSDILNSSFEDGLTGIVLDPDFDNNGWIFLYYCRKVGNWTFRVSRFTYNGSTIDPNSEIAIIDIPRNQATRMHTGGAMEFDSYGDLWFSVGENEGGNQGPGCTADGRGAVYRITPLPGGGYSIPAGNFAEYWAAKFEAAGNTSLAANYRNPDLVWPELFIKGARNPYNINVDPVKRWVGWADCGPDHGGLHEEHNMAAAPGFFGYPWFAGNNLLRPGQNNDVDHPANNECGTTLPPAVPATHPYQQACAMGSPIFFYDQSNPSSVQFPPNFHRKWFIGDFNQNKIDWVTTTEVSSTRAGMTFPIIQISNLESFLPGTQFHAFLDAEFGPDGALYMNNYAGWFNASINTAIVRVEYIGDAPSQQCIEAALGADYIPPAGSRISPAGNGSAIASTLVKIFTGGRHSVTISSLSGRLLKTIPGQESAEYELKGMVKPGLYMVTTQTEKGVYSKQVLFL